MKKVISLFTLIILFTFGMNTASFADTTSDSIAKVEAEIAAKAKSDSADKLKAEKEIAPKAVNKVKVGIVQKVKQYFIDGGPEFMALVFLVFLLGLALSIERIIYLNMSTTDNQKLLSK